MSHSYNHTSKYRPTRGRPGRHPGDRRVTARGVRRQSIDLTKFTRAVVANALAQAQAEADAAKHDPATGDGKTPDSNVSTTNGDHHQGGAG